MKKTYLMTLLALFIGLNSFAQGYGSLLKETPGVVSYTYRTQLAKDMPGTLDEIKSHGITNMEFSNLFKQTSQYIREQLDMRGMRCTSYGTGYKNLEEDIETVIKDAKTLGAKFVRIAWVPHTGPMTIELAEQTVKDFNTFGKKLKENGLTFCYHNHGYEFAPYKNGTYFDYIVQNTNPKYVSFEMDILWVFHPGQDPAALLLKYPKRFKLMHVKDLKKGVEGDLSGSTPITNDVALGTGQLDLPAILKAAKKTKIENFYIEDENPKSHEQVPQSLAYLKSL
ncbi:Sugar phosphate isomerase/epimerase [Spirosomataceae bacterium TFI 002]|nr:Sugar phosphate isomerase/epimerase [Spirosomataceae bacterium TFI 002]